MKIVEEFLVRQIEPLIQIFEVGTVIHTLLRCSALLRTVRVGSLRIATGTPTIPFWVYRFIYNPPLSVLKPHATVHNSKIMAKPARDVKREVSLHADPPPAIVSEPKEYQYETAEQLGKGGFAICHRATVLEKGKRTGRIVALKIVKAKMEPAKLAQKVRSAKDL